MPYDLTVIAKTGIFNNRRNPGPGYIRPTRI